MRRLFLYFLITTSFSCDYNSENNSSSKYEIVSQIDIFLLSDNTLSFQGEKLQINAFEKALNNVLKSSQDTSEYVFYLKVSSKANLKSLSEIREILKSKGVKKIKFEQFTEEEEVIYKV